MADKKKTTKKTASKAPKKPTATAKIQQLEKRIAQLEQMVTGTRPARPQPRPMSQRPQPRPQMAQGGRPQMPMQGAPRGPQGPSRPMGGMRPGGMA